MNKLGVLEIVNTSSDKVSAGGITWQPYEKKSVVRATEDIKRELKKGTRLKLTYPSNIHEFSFRSIKNTLADYSNPEYENAVPFKYSADDIPEPELDPVYTESEPVNENFLKPNGTLIVGTGNPNTDLMQIENDQIALALGVRRTRDVNTIPPEDGVFSVEVTKTQDWIVVFLVTGINCIPTNYYDIQLTFFGDSEGSKDSSKGFVSFKLEGDLTGYVWKCNLAGRDIIDSYFSDDGKAVGNINRYTYYPEIINPPVENPPPYVGTFIIQLSAKHKSSGEQLLLEATANITLIE